jgi:hypothetical protein
VVLPIAVLWVVVLWSAPLYRGLLSIALPLLISLNTVRLLGVFFLILYTTQRLPSLFAHVAGWGDIIIGLTAAPVAWLVHRHLSSARATVLIWNALGLLDLVAAIVLGVISSPGPLRLILSEPGTAVMTTLPWLLIPGFLVPLLILTHVAIFYRVARRRIQEVHGESNHLKHRIA